MVYLIHFPDNPFRSTRLQRLSRNLSEPSVFEIDNGTALLGVVFVVVVFGVVIVLCKTTPFSHTIVAIARLAKPFGQ